MTPCKYKQEYEISGDINHLTCYRFKCSHWLKLHSTNESTQIITGFVIYNPVYTYKFQLKTTIDLILGEEMVPGAGGKLWQKHSGTSHMLCQHMFGPFLTHPPSHPHHSQIREWNKFSQIGTYEKIFSISWFELNPMAHFWVLQKP